MTVTLELLPLVSARRNKGLKQILTFPPSDFHLHHEVINHGLQNLDAPPFSILLLPNLRY